VTRGARLLAAVGIAATAAFAVPAAPAVASPGGECEGVVDFDCRDHHCQPDELDCGLIPPCTIYVAGLCIRL
jgi:hypothetical protein